MKEKFAFHPFKSKRIDVELDKVNIITEEERT